MAGPAALRETGRWPGLGARISDLRAPHQLRREGYGKAGWINPAVSARWLRHAHASHAIDEGVPITLVSQRSGMQI